MKACTTVYDIDAACGSNLGFWFQGSITEAAASLKTQEGLSHRHALMPLMERACLERESCDTHQFVRVVLSQARVQNLLEQAVEIAHVICARGGACAHEAYLAVNFAAGEAGGETGEQ